MGDSPKKSKHRAGTDWRDTKLTQETYGAEPTPAQRFEGNIILPLFFFSPFIYAICWIIWQVLKAIARSIG